MAELALKQQTLTHLNTSNIAGGLLSYQKGNQRSPNSENGQTIQWQQEKNIKQWFTKHYTDS
jgi:hypothetical protein